jgi:hypothetical protein
VANKKKGPERARGTHCFFSCLRFINSLLNLSSRIQDQQVVSLAHVYVLQADWRQSPERSQKLQAFDPSSVVMIYEFIFFLQQMNDRVARVNFLVFTELTKNLHEP